MRTTVRLDDGLLTAAKEYSARTGRTLTAVLEDALRAYLAREQGAQPTTLPSLPTFGRGGVLPGVDIDNSADLLDTMEGPDAAR